jgi:hypothetical protein
MLQAVIAAMGVAVVLAIWSAVFGGWLHWLLTVTAGVLITAGGLFVVWYASREPRS